jgi:hypothetical protein
VSLRGAGRTWAKKKIKQYKEDKEIYNQAYRKAKKKQIVKKAQRHAKVGRYADLGERMMTGAGFMLGADTMKSRPKKHHKGYKKRSKKAGKQFAIVGGKAYPIAGSIQKKKKKRKSTTTYDPWGW